MDPPKTKGVDYIRLYDVNEVEKLKFNKCEIEIKDSKLYVDGREVNDFILDGNSVIVKAQHYTSKEFVSDIRTLRRFVPWNEEDNYVYFLENDFYNLSPSEIRHISGASGADVKFQVEFIVDLRRVWIKIQRNHPLKLAIYEGLSSDEIIEISLERI